ncbi:hypothetical protein [Caulobacter sp.]|uniref:hypothetical protein n=1 Tax=Caulobacter sp. TaxID=78 RepID=UPI002B45A246|nr:hypothetical protein [Caulobacter sp.]HJV43180.1 hypothetical protein [Caulobacter sp.]
MAAQVLSFFQRSPRYTPAPADWSQQELAEFYRVEAALSRAGIRVGTDRGLSDEKEPWFVFYRTDDGEVVIHFARIDGEYLIAGPAYEEIARGFDFSSMVRNMVARHPLIRRSDRGDNIALHPAALLVAVVGTAFFKTGEARAAETGAANAPSHARPTLLSSSSSAGLTGGAAPVAAASGMAQPVYDTVQLPANQAVLVLAAALLAADFTVDAASLDPAAQATLASAAASLEFNAPVAPIVTSGEADGTGVAAHAAAVANTPVQTVSSVLSLVALLSTLPQTADAPAAPELAPSVPDSARHEVALSPLPAPALHDGADWSLEVRLAAGSLPSIEAVQLVRSLVGDAAAAQKITVIEVSKLPDVLAEIISRGEHVQVAPVTAQPAEALTETPATSATGETPVSSGHDTVTAPSTDAQTPAAHSAIMSEDLVKQFIDYFIAHTDHVAMMMNGSQVVIYDPLVMSNPSAIDHIVSLNFELADHSQINLVGASDAFLNVGILL